MRARNHLRIAGVDQRALERALDPGRASCSPISRARLIRPARTTASRRETRVAVVDAQPDDVEGRAAPGDRDLNPGDEAQAQAARRRNGFVQASHLVVVGEREQFDAPGRWARVTSSAGRSVPSEIIEWE